MGEPLLAIHSTRFPTYTPGHAHPLEPLMSLQTFRKPEALDVAPLPEVGAPAPELPLDAAQKRVVAFLRHVGCPFAEATVKRLRAASQEHPDVAWVAVSHADEAPTWAWVDSIGGPGDVAFVYDPSRRLYAAWGLGLSSMAHFTGPRTLARIAALWPRGIRNRRASGNRWQMAGTFAVDERGVVRWRHTPRYAGDLPDFQAAVDSLSLQDSP